jgi:predicted secreted hydrolase
MKRLFFTAGLLTVLALLLVGCSFPGVISSTQRLPTVSQQTPPASLPPVRFPQDEGAHNDLTEWWYYTGHLVATAPDGKRHEYGFELVVFQALRSDLPPVYPSHFAISDITRNEFHYDQRRVIEPIPVPDGTSTRGIDVHVGDWSIKGLNGQDHLSAAMQNYAINLGLKATKPVTLHNGNGLITNGLSGFSYYYSRTRMAVSGTIMDHNQPLQVTGQAWMDHQWGNFLTLGGGGWDWYSFQFDNNSEMLVYFIRDATGKIISTYAGYIDQRGNETVLPGSAIQGGVLGSWTSPTTGITYPSGWRLAVNDARLHMTLTITPQLKNQELVTYNSTGNTYWEGAVTIQGRNGNASIGGKGYVELTGYTKH